MNKGSEWIRWDLHVHTRSSKDYKYMQDDAEEKLVEEWKRQGIKAVAITDHFIIDSDRINKLRELAKGEITIFPGVELRTDKGSTNIHVIGIFSEHENLKNLQNDFEAIMLRSNKNKDKFEKIFWDFKEIEEFIRDRNGIITIHAGNKSNGIEEISNENAFTMAVKESYSHKVDIFEHNNTHSCKGYENSVFKVTGIKPQIVCSDNHDPLNYQYSDKLWIKSQPTFKGLLQAIKHPTERIYIGSEPQKINHEKFNKQYIIEEIKISKNKNSLTDDMWFDTTIPLNSSLTAIIGNKGSGKSALSDIIALTAESDKVDENNASFLNNKRFNKPPQKYGDNYESTLTWKDKHVNKIESLMLETSDNYNNYVQYLPQKYIEKVCTSLEGEFQQEINNVIFAYINESDKLDSSNFNELISKKIGPIDKRIKENTDKLDSINYKIIQLEEKKSNKYREQLEKKLKNLTEQLKRQQSQKPKEINKPKEYEQNNEIERIKKNIEEIKKNIDEKNQNISILNKKIQDLEELVTQVEIEINNIKKINENIKENFSYLDNFTLKIDANINHLDVVEKEFRRKKEIEQKDSKYLNNKLNDLEKEYNSILEKSNDKTQSYQKYLKELEEWEISLKKIKSASYGENTIEFVEKELEYINGDINSKLTNLKNEQKKYILNIYNLKREIIAVYNDIYSSIEPVIKEIVSEIESGIKFTSQLNVEVNNASDFTNLLNKQHKSIFNGIENAKKEMTNLLNDINPEDQDSILNFINRVIDGCGGTDYDLLNKVIKNKKEFYNKLTNLEYIKIDYNLSLNNKELQQLSPGERGLVLIIFYLALNKEKEPIIIDQPEDNLDNESVYTKLVPCIIQAKKDRQVIIVTHNPNIAIACDAEQIIISSIDKENNKITYKSGSIENPEINSKVVDILEGTRPAFDLREKKYIL
ncbi:TrlF family AAA-like ATPase [Staphylococcus hominis]|uniref:TrlF family AAA-like ATPase n=1 Tax=Staphylococcus hominis TaxID=1290 RepID=UPI0039B5B4DC